STWRPLYRPAASRESTALCNHRGWRRRKTSSSPPPRDGQEDGRDGRRQDRSQVNWQRQGCFLPQLGGPQQGRDSTGSRRGRRLRIFGIAYLNLASLARGAKKLLRHGDCYIWGPCRAAANAPATASGAVALEFVEELVLAGEHLYEVGERLSGGRCLV